MQRRNPVRLGIPQRCTYPRRRRMDVRACPGRNARDTMSVTHLLHSAHIEAWLADPARLGLCAGRTNLARTDGRLVRWQAQIRAASESAPLRAHTVFMPIASNRRGEETPFRSSRRLSFQAWRNKKPTPHGNLTRLIPVIWTYHRKPPLWALRFVISSKAVPRPPTSRDTTGGRQSARP
jgi:hypothetical protein